MSALRSRPARGRAVVGAAAAVVVVGAATIVVVRPFGGAAPSGAGELDNGAATSLVSLSRRDLSSQTQVSATLGYAGPSAISVPAGTAPASVLQAQQAVASARTSVESAQATLAADARVLGEARATLAADRRKQSIDCSGADAAESPGSSASGSGTSPCATDAQAVAAGEQTVAADAQKVDGDRRAVASAQTALAGAEQSLAAADSSAAVYGQTSVYTWLPAVGTVVRRGQELYAIGGDPTLLLYGAVTPWRSFAAGMSPGRDVEELNANLRALGYGHTEGSAFTGDTAAAIAALQTAHGVAATGRLLLGSVAFEAGAVRVTAVTPTLGAPVQAGKVLDVTSMRRQVSIELDAAQQAEIKVGDPVTITLPDNTTAAGRVSFVGTVATTPSSNNGQDSTPTIEVDITPTHPAETGRLDQAPVDVSITTATVKNVLAVPVSALLALAGGGYAIERAEAGGARRLVPVSMGLFDDADGLVEVSGSGLAAGQRVVVPAA